ncbi:phosphoglycerate dehydrogenase [Falsibacillus albus]|uniref:D-3-phosphoglycerate dehydrogenase n=1 Tax=Falsibacillus albus TaxID=2478915 RepID=A0A3L7K190_9BACI|nr:phosphoglycerate dehydrogenase [Falsibacillus albus]RLQ96843.1 3-phosphoglycerate dehydrogenase [Falsibacillus albus]
MYQIQVYNQIAKKGTDLFSEEKYRLTDTESPDGVLLRSYPLTEEHIPESVKAIARAGAGVNNIPVADCTKKGIVVFNTPGANANAVKELVITSLIASSRKLFEAVQWTQTIQNAENLERLVEIEKKKYIGSEIQGKYIGVVGAGAIGVLVANAALALDMEVIAFDPFISVNSAWLLSRNVQRAMSLDEVFTKCDYITLHMPLSDKTKGIINASGFDKMKEGVQVLNFSRGELVNEDDLENALESGKVGKYITDFPNERVLNMKNVVATPHLGASTQESEENCAIMAVQQLRSYLETGNIKNSVNFADVELPYIGKKRLTIAHQNIPNMVGQITALLAANSINIADMINRSKGDYAYTIIDLDQDIDHDAEEILKGKVKVITGVTMIRFI